MEAYKSAANQLRDPRLFFYRTEKGFEVDLIKLNGMEVVPIEVKSAMTYSKNLIANLEAYCQQDCAATEPCLVYDGANMDGLGDVAVRARNVRDWT